MLFRQTALQIACVLMLVACGDRKADQARSTAEKLDEAIAKVELLDADSAPVASLLWAREGATGCIVLLPDDDIQDIGIDGGNLVLSSTETKRLAVLERDPSGNRLVGGNAERVARIASEPGPPRRISALDAEGIALFRLSSDDMRRATLLDKASVPAFTVSPKGKRLVTKARDDTITYFVRGTDDAVLAGLLTAPALDLPYRMLLACDYLLGSTHDS